MKIKMIAAMAKNGVIGKDGKIPWHCPEDLKLFKQKTLGKPIIMGRKTFESLPGILPDRRHIVMTRNRQYEAEGALVAHSVREALNMSWDSDEVWVIGGREIYQLFTDCADELHLSVMHKSYEGDVRMMVPTQWEEGKCDIHPDFSLLILKNPRPYNPLDVRPSWDELFMSKAHKTAERATCDRKHVGCVIVRDNRELVSGYNGSIPGEPHCDDEGHMMVDGHCVRTIHAEQNAIVDAAREGISLKDSTAYVTCSRCWICFKLLASVGVKEIVYDEFYRNDSAEVADRLGIKMRQI